MTEYRVIWEIDIDADTPTEAALAARAIQQDANSIATVFDVTPRCADCGYHHADETKRVDLHEKEGERVH